MKKLALVIALALGGCAQDLVAEYPGAGGPCDPLYRFQSAAGAQCRYDWRTGYIAQEGQAVPRPRSLVQVEREVQGTVDRRLPSR
jgi:hypothetical protein